MSLGRLLAAGRSLVGGQDHGRYRVNKHLALPKFISPRNPFTAAPKPDAVTDVAELPERAEDEKNTIAPPQAATAKPAKNDLGMSLGAKAARWLGALRQKINPFSRLARQPKSAKSVLPRFTKAPIQAELSLDQVKVVRNDLSDADLEVVPMKTPVVILPAKADEKFALAGTAWEQVSTRMFGSGQTD